MTTDTDALNAQIAVLNIQKDNNNVSLANQIKLQTAQIVANNTRIDVQITNAQAQIDKLANPTPVIQS